MPDELITNRIKAFVVGQDGLTESELVAVCTRLLPRYMVPDSFVFRNTLPKSSTGKIDRLRLVADEEDASVDS